ncbi:MAG: hypothetical protein JWN72_799 [Thermoleophilia bacterium]|nr:hypothetical protein [Thermoleophilia bacterium]
MANIPKTVSPTPAANPQLGGIVTTVPMPIPQVPTSDGQSAAYNPFTNLVTLGGQANPGYSISMPVAGSGNVVTNPMPGASGVGAAANGGGATTPANNAQPAAPGAAAAQTPAPAAAPVTATPAGTKSPIANAPANVATPAAAAAAKAGKNAPSAATASGFGRTDKSAPLKVSVSGAKFSFPSFNSTAKQTDAPKVTWGTDWKQVDTGNGFYYMEHANGTKAVPATEYRLAATPLDKVQTIKVANGWGKKFPDGTIVVFDKDKGAYKIKPDGSKEKLPFGKQEIGGVKVRIFEASVVRTLEPNGAVRVFDSRGTTSLGTTRGHAASVAGGGANQVGTTVSTTTPANNEALIAKIQEITGLTRQMIGQVQAGTVNPTELAAIQTKLSALPAGLQQAIAAGGSMPAATGTLVAGGGATTTTPVAGAKVDDGIKQLAAGASAKLAGTIPTDLVGMQARFGQLSEEMQSAVAKGFGSDQGSKAFEADAQIAFKADGTATVVEATRAFTKKVVQIRGAGPGEDLVMTMKPVRQPSSPGIMAGDAKPSVKAAGSKAGSQAGVGAAGDSASPIGSPVVAGGGVGATAGTKAAAAKIQLFTAGGRLSSPGLTGIQGTFTWKTLPAAARTAIQQWLATNNTSPAGAALASRTGVGWNFDQDAQIVVGGNEATFLQGLSIVKSSTAAATGTGATGGGAPASGGATGGGGTPPAGTGPTTTPVGHDATKPPVSGGGAAAGATPPAGNPPTPAVGAAMPDMTGMKM